MLVVDASVLVFASIDAGAVGKWAEAVIARGNLFAPHLVFVEAANVLRRLERAKDLTVLEATAALGTMVRLDVQLVAFEPFADRVWELRSNVSPYDAWYVAVAESLKLPLATLDRRLGHATGPRCRFLLPPDRAARG